MWCSSEHFAGYEQQDAHEFLMAMLAGIYSSMHEEAPRNKEHNGHAVQPHLSAADGARPAASR